MTAEEKPMVVKQEDNISLLKSIDMKLDTLIEEIRSLKQALSTGFQPKIEKQEPKWRLSSSGKSEWIFANEDPELAKRLQGDVDRWREIGDYIYRLSEDGQIIRRVKKVGK